MRTWKIFIKEKVEPEAVKVGFNWWAFLIPLSWSFCNRLFKKWFTGFSLLFLCSVIWMFTVMWLYREVPSTEEFNKAFNSVHWLEVVLSFVFGFNGNKWFSGYLKEEGYQVSVTLEAENAKEALAKYSTTNLDNL